MRGRERLGFEVKRTDAPKLTPSMRAALADLELSRIYVVHAGKTSFDLDRQVRAVAATELLTEL